MFSNFMMISRYEFACILLTILWLHLTDKAQDLMYPWVQVPCWCKNRLGGPIYHRWLFFSLWPRWMVSSLAPSPGGLTRFFYPPLGSRWDLSYKSRSHQGTRLIFCCHINVKISSLISEAILSQLQLLLTMLALALISGSWELPFLTFNLKEVSLASVLSSCSGFKIPFWNSKPRSWLFLLTGFFWIFFPGPHLQDLVQSSLAKIKSAHLKPIL